MLVNRLGPVEDLLERATDTERWAKGWLDGAAKTLGRLLGCNVGTLLVMGFVLGRMDDTVKIDGFADGNGFSHTHCVNGVHPVPCIPLFSKKTLFLWRNPPGLLT